MSQNEALSFLPPFTGKAPTNECPRSPEEVWDEYMDYREAVVDFFREGHYEEIDDPDDARKKIDEMFYINRKKYMRSRLDKQLDNS